MLFLNAPGVLGVLVLLSLCLWGLTPSFAKEPWEGQVLLATVTTSLKLTKVPSVSSELCEMMRYKPGVSIQGIQPEIVATFNVIETAFSPKEAIITSAKDGKHRPGSLHYSGNAVDLRTRHLIEGEAGEILIRLDTWLTDEFDVVLEEDHIHVEFQPKS